MLEICVNVANTGQVLQRPEVSIRATDLIHLDVLDSESVSPACANNCVTSLGLRCVGSSVKQCFDEA